MSFLANDSGVWKPSSPYINDAGISKPWKNGYINDAGVWKEFYSDLLLASWEITSGQNNNTNGYPQTGYVSAIAGFTPCGSAIPDGTVSNNGYLLHYASITVATSGTTNWGVGVAQSDGSPVGDYASKYLVVNGSTVEFVGGGGGGSTTPPGPFTIPYPGTFTVELWAKPPTPPPVITVVSVSDAGAQASSVAVPAPLGIVAGNLLYAVFSCDDTAATVSLACAGWTLHKSYIFTTHNDNGFIGAFYKIATGSEPSSYTFSGGTVHAVNVGIIQIANVSSTDPFNSIVPTVFKAATSVTPLFPAITTTQPGSILIVAAQAGSYSGSVSNVFTPDATYTNAVSSVSQYNMGSSYDAEVVYAALSNDNAIPAGSNTPPSGTFNKTYAYGTMTVFLNPAS